MPFTQFANLDFDQIKTSIKDYLRANSNFTDFDFEGSNFSVLIDTLAYNTYITAFNTNMTVNESFLDSATVRENVVSLARNIGYVPRSRSAAQAIISFTATPPTGIDELTLQPNLICVGKARETSYTFAITDFITKPVVNGVATFNNIKIYQGTFLSKTFTVNGSIDQRFILDNPYIDTKSIVVYVKGSVDSGFGAKYSPVENIININKNSEIYLIQEVQDEKYELLFGDGYFGKKLENGAVITIFYLTTDGKDGNGAEFFDFQGSFLDQDDRVVTPSISTITVNQKSINGSDSESINSIKYFAPRLYSSQYRAVTSSDYESIVSKIYPNTESVSVIGGEELSPPQFGTVLISIKPKNGTFVSDFDKNQILSKLKQYSIAGINQKIVDLKILYVEIVSYIYYDYGKTGNVLNLKSNIKSNLIQYSKSLDLNKFGGRFKYSKLLQVIDNTDVAVTSNITRIRIRRDLKSLINRSAQYELCFGNQFHINPKGFNIKSTGFTILNYPDTVYLTDTPNSDGKTGILSICKPSLTSENSPIIVQSAGIVRYDTGEIILNTIHITSTVLENDVIEIQAFPESNDIIGLKDLYVSFDVSKSEINMTKDVISSGEDTSGVIFTRDYFKSSYSNGELARIIKEEEN
jgi:hypothetical protein